MLNYCGAPEGNRETRGKVARVTPCAPSEGLVQTRGAQRRRAVPSTLRKRDAAASRPSPVFKNRFAPCFRRKASGARLDAPRVKPYKIGVPALVDYLRLPRRAGAGMSWLRAWASLLLAAPLCLPPNHATMAGAGITIYFFSPETNINNFSSLKGEFDSFFAGVGHHKFQPFRDRESFETALKDYRPGLFLMSSWHYSQLPDKTRWEPVLIGTLKRLTTQRHVLCSKKAVESLPALSGRTIASAGTREFTLNLLLQILGRDQLPLVNSLNVLTVPKDIDALMAVGFGVAQAAVTTESGLDKLFQTNPKQHEQLRALATGPESLLPVVVAPADAGADCQALISVLQSMAADPEGRQRLRMLGLEGWQPVEEAQRKLLRK